MNGDTISPASKTRFRFLQALFRSWCVLGLLRGGMQNIYKKPIVGKSFFLHAMSHLALVCCDLCEDVFWHLVARSLRAFAVKIALCSRLSLL